jgi:hypothetical protein
MVRKIRSLWTRWQIRKVSRLLAQLTPAETLEFMMNRDTGLGLEDCNSLVALAFGNCPEEDREATIRRISENYLRARKIIS